MSSIWIMENILSSVSFPAEFHAQAAVEVAMALHLQAARRFDEIERVTIETQTQTDPSALAAGARKASGIVSQLESNLRGRIVGV
jgi:2-methylcitrate dehydratase PrpD